VAGRGRALRPPLTPADPPRVEAYGALAARIAARPARLGRTRLVAVDGRGGAGKTTFAARLAAALGDAPVVHADDVADRAGHPWWPTLEELVLGPLGAGTGWTDPGTGALRPVPAVLVLEGVSASRRAVTDRLTLAAWLDVPARTRVARGIARDGPDSAAAWPRYEAEEDRFFAADPVAGRADLMVDGAPALPHDPVTEYVRLR
jgi:hypothetical protein